MTEPVIEPDLPIIDPHHHLWFIPPAALEELESRRERDVTARELAAMFASRPRYLLEELRSDTDSGHDVRATVYIEAGSMYRPDGPPHLRTVGEVEFANGIGAMAASGSFGATRHCAGIVGRPDLRAGDAVREQLEAHVRAGGERYRGVRNTTTYDERRDALSRGLGAEPHLLMNPTFRAAVRHLQTLGLSLDVSISAPQLPELIDLARSFPETQIILDHLGGPVVLEPDGRPSQEIFRTWRDQMRLAAGCPNLAVKLGGLGNPLSGLPRGETPEPVDSETLARTWRPYIEPCIEAFGPERCMFESNFPVDGMTASYRVVWNAFKRIAGGASESEKTALFFDTARRVYRLEV